MEHVEREAIRDMDSEKLVALFERVLRNGAGSEYYLVVWTRSELIERLSRAGATVQQQVERCPTCGEALADGVGHDHRDVDVDDHDGRPTRK